VGDAATTVDPLTRLGIHQALSSGIEAAEAITDALAGRRGGIRRYRQILASSFESLLETRRKIYERESRFAEQPFWARRADRVTLEADFLLSYDETAEKEARIDSLDMHLPPRDLRLLCSLAVSPRLSRSVAAAFEEHSERKISRRRILLALQYLVEQGILSAD
jgi:flavin-dependent dehydrogenase